ncbi:MAG TPA: hypothetical protein VHB79_24685 [Polyangiaceae bacterium]|nr:hypothetical protein [Polyangiaceae bacterium]
MKLARFLPLACAGWQLACSDAPRGTSEPSQPVYVASQTCRFKSAEAWQHFLEEWASEPGWVKTCSDLDDCAKVSGELAARVRAEILPVFSECEGALHDNPSVAACADRLRSFAPAWLRQHASDSYGFELANPDYFSAQVADDTPAGMMDPPPALLAALPVRAAMEAAADSHGWAHLTHDSCLGGVRTFFHVVDPEARFEQWLLFGVDAEQPDLQPQSLISFLAIQKQNADGSALERARLHFRDYAIAQDGDTWRLELPLGNSGKCYACHGSGVRQLVQFPESEALTNFNAQLASYGLPDWNATIRSENYGPALGSELGCTACHDGKQRGPLTVFTSEGMLYQKVLEQLSMGSFTGSEVVPDWPSMQLRERERIDASSLSAAESAALAAARRRHQADYEQLMGSRLPELTRWLTATRCDNGPTGSR